MSIRSLRPLLLAAACCSFLGCAHSSDPLAKQSAKATEEVRGVVKDPAAADQLAVIVGELTALARQREKARADYHRKWSDLNADYDATPDQFADLLASYDAEMVGLTNRVLELRSRAAGLTTDKEWKELQRARTTLSSETMSN